MPDTARVLVVAGARPNFMKVAPLLRALAAWNLSGSRPCRFEPKLVHTGQHYDALMSDVFFSELGLPEPDHFLEVGSGSHAVQTAAVLERLEPVIIAERPDLVVVVGDVNSTLAAALCAAKLEVPVAHIEAGLRSGDRSMPEELNRLLTDQLADLLFVTESDALVNLRREGVPAARVHFVGNTMIDSLQRVRARVDVPGVLAAAELEPGGYALVTLHRPSNVDDAARLEGLARALADVSTRIPVVWPVHVRTAERIGSLPLVQALLDDARVVRRAAAAYGEFVALMAGARLVLTDSGGVQEETTVLGVPCLTLRTSTERPVTLSEGTNRLIDPDDPAAIIGAVDGVLAVASQRRGTRPALWDGKAAERIVDTIGEWYCGRHAHGPGGRAFAHSATPAIIGQGDEHCAGSRRVSQEAHRPDAVGR